MKLLAALGVSACVLGWTGLARVVRGRFLSLREDDFVMAARFCGASEARIIFRHMVPSFLSHIIASLTLAIPGMILAETALSFLGLGLRPPTISWGVLLQEAQNVQTVALFPWLLVPGVWTRFAIGVPLNFLFAMLWPIGKGESLSSVPGRPGTVTAVNSLFGFLPLTLVFGVLSESFGLTPMMLVVHVGALLVLIGVVLALPRFERDPLPRPLP